MRNLKSISRAFDMSIDDFAKFIGYTRQGLYTMRKGEANKKRVDAALTLLVSKSMDMLNAEILDAYARKNSRIEAIMAFVDEALGDSQETADG